VLDAETLLLVDDDETEIGELHVLGKQSMRADDEIDAAGAQLFEHLLLLGGSLESADRLDPERVVAEPFAERPLVLLGKHRRRHEHRDLLSELDGLERSADGDLRLAEADVAA